MALIPCKNCGKTISSSAKQCPHCKIALLEFNNIDVSYNKKSISNFYKNLIILFIIVGIISSMLYYNYAIIKKEIANSDKTGFNEIKEKNTPKKVQFSDESFEGTKQNKYECKQNMKTIASALELYQMENGTILSITPEQLLQNGYLRNVPECPSAPGEKFFNYFIYPGNKEVRVKCKVHGTFNFKEPIF